MCIFCLLLFDFLLAELCQCCNRVRCCVECRSEKAKKLWLFVEIVYCECTTCSSQWADDNEINLLLELESGLQSSEHWVLVKINFNFCIRLRVLFKVLRIKSWIFPPGQRMHSNKHHKDWNWIPYGTRMMRNWKKICIKFPFLREIFHLPLFCHCCELIFLSLSPFFVEHKVKSCHEMWNMRWDKSDDYDVATSFWTLSQRADKIIFILSPIALFSPTLRQIRHRYAGCDDNLHSTLQRELLPLTPITNLCAIPISYHHKEKLLFPACFTQSLTDVRETSSC